MTKIALRLNNSKEKYFLFFVFIKILFKKSILELKIKKKKIEKNVKRRHKTS